MNNASPDVQTLVPSSPENTLLPSSPSAPQLAEAVLVETSPRVGISSTLPVTSVDDPSQDEPFIHSINGKTSPCGKVRYPATMVSNTSTAIVSSVHTPHLHTPHHARELVLDNSKPINSAQF